MEDLAILNYTGEDYKPVVSFAMEKFKCYNVKKAVWHTIATSRDAHVRVVENADTKSENSEFMHKKVKVKL